VPKVKFVTMNTRLDGECISVQVRNVTGRVVNIPSDEKFSIADAW